MTDHRERPTYIIHLQPTPTCEEPIKALRRLLKLALRSLGLRCTHARKSTPREIGMSGDYDDDYHRAWLIVIDLFQDFRDGWFLKFRDRRVAPRHRPLRR